MTSLIMNNITYNMTNLLPVSYSHIMLPHHSSRSQVRTYPYAWLAKTTPADVQFFDDLLAAYIASALSSGIMYPIDTYKVTVTALTHTYIMCPRTVATHNSSIASHTRSLLRTLSHTIYHSHLFPSCRYHYCRRPVFKAVVVVSLPSPREASSDSGAACCSSSPTPTMRSMWPPTVY